MKQTKGDIVGMAIIMIGILYLLAHTAIHYVQTVEESALIRGAEYGYEIALQDFEQDLQSITGKLDTIDYIIDKNNLNAQ